MTQEIINRLKELLAKAPPLENWQEVFDALDLTPGNAYPRLLSALSTLTNLTPSGVERIRAEAFEEAAKVAEEIIAGREEVRVIPAHEENDDGDVWLVPEMTQNVRIMAFGTIPAAIRALALPSEPPAQVTRYPADGGLGEQKQPLDEAFSGFDMLRDRFAPPSQGDVDGRALA